MILFPAPITDPPDAVTRTLPELLKPSSIGSPRLTVEYATRDDPPDSRAFITWWIQRWNVLLGKLLDPAIHFRPPKDWFSPQLMVGRYVSLLRMLACLQEILVNTARDEFVRTMMLFDVLDMMKGFGMGEYDRNADPRVVEQDFANIEREALSQSPAAANVVLARCQTALEALQALRSGFVESPADIDVAVRHLEQELRNARHGFDKESRSEAAMKAFFSHRVDVSPDLADLAWLHMVRMLLFATWQTSGEFQARRSRRASGTMDPSGATARHQP